MEQVAAAAGVGKATLYRRYPDVASIAVALLDEHERALQERLLRGPPPLGPGAPPAERLAAFYAAMVELLERHGHLALAAETGPRRFATGAYRAWALHVGALLEAAGRDPGPGRHAARAARARRLRPPAGLRPVDGRDRRGRRRGARRAGNLNGAWHRRWPVAGGERHVHRAVRRGRFVAPRCGVGMR